MVVFNAESTRRQRFRQRTVGLEEPIMQQAEAGERRRVWQRAERLRLAAEQRRRDDSGGDHI
jgi:hypothetical protein